MSKTLNGQSYDIGDTIKFTSMNPKDTRVWSGKVVGFCGYEVATGYGDIINYYQQVLSGLGSANQVSLLASSEFIIINTETENGSVLQTICPEWIIPESFSVVKAEQSYTIQVFTHDGSTVYDVLKILRDNGFTCRSLS